VYALLVMAIPCTGNVTHSKQLPSDSGANIPNVHFNNELPARILCLLVEACAGFPVLC
jgi:hypothetical protein